jgi:glycosyltransferase involved in cell wall biosynthesis
MHIRDSSGIFGAERVILGLGKALDRERFDVTLLCMRRASGVSEPLIEKAREMELRVFTVDVRGKFDRAALAAIRRIFLTEKVSLFHSHDFKSDFYGRLASWGLGIKRVSTAHGSTRDSLSKRAYLFFNERIVYKTFDRIIAVSVELERQLQAKGLSGNRVSLVQNGLDLDSLTQTFEPFPAAPPLDMRDGHILFSVIGRLYPDKGHRYFLEALARVRQKHPEVKALLVGDGPARPEIEEHVRRLGLEQAVCLLGVRSDMGHIYSYTDCLVISSLREGLPYVLLEAMAMGVPVLATRVGEIPNLIKDGENGLLVPPGDVEALAAGMERYLEAGDRRVLWAERGKELVRRNYSVEAMASKVGSIYAALLAQKKIRKLE